MRFAVQTKRAFDLFLEEAKVFYLQLAIKLQVRCTARLMQVQGMLLTCVGFCLAGRHPM